MTQTQDARPAESRDALRTRTFAWTDPSVHAGLLGRRSGLELMEDMAAGEIPPPPIMELVGLAGMAVDEGRVTFYLDPREYHYNPLGTVHGGIIATMLDSAA